MQSKHIDRRELCGGVRAHYNVLMYVVEPILS